MPNKLVRVEHARAHNSWWPIVRFWPEGLVDVGWRNRCDWLLAGSADVTSHHSETFKHGLTTVLGSYRDYPRRASVLRAMNLRDFECLFLGCPTQRNDATDFVARCRSHKWGDHTPAPGCSWVATTAKTQQRKGDEGDWSAMHRF